jgi:hypothetical protein
LSPTIRETAGACGPRPNTLGGMTSAAAGAASDPEMPGRELPGIQVTRAVNSMLREMRAAEPRKAAAVDAAISSIPRDSGVPVRIDVPGAPPGREYKAVVPFELDVPVVIYRRLEPGDRADGDWLVTTLIDRDEFDDYQRAAMRGILDNPAVREITARLARSLAIIISSSEHEPKGSAG